MYSLLLHVSKLKIIFWSTKNVDVYVWSTVASIWLMLFSPFFPCFQSHVLFGILTTMPPALLVNLRYQLNSSFAFHIFLLWLLRTKLYHVFFRLWIHTIGDVAVLVTLAVFRCHCSALVLWMIQCVQGRPFLGMNAGGMLSLVNSILLSPSSTNYLIVSLFKTVCLLL